VAPYVRSRINADWYTFNVSTSSSFWRAFQRIIFNWAPLDETNVDAEVPKQIYLFLKYEYGDENELF